MTLYLVQHGKALPKDVDPERGLSEDGKAETERMAARAEVLRLSVSGIAHSGKRRARETADIFANHLTPGALPFVLEGLDPNDAPAAFAERIGEEDGLMIVGHLPFLERLTAYLTSGDLSLRPVRFTNSGIVRLEAVPGKNGRPIWSVTWALTPEIV